MEQNGHKIMSRDGFINLGSCYFLLNSMI